MATPWLRRISRIAIAVVVIAALATPWAFPALTTAVATKIAKVIPPLSLPLIVLLAVEATLVLVAAIWWLWWRLPQRQIAKLALKIRDPKARADTEDNFRKTVGQALGGAAVLIGAGAAYLQFSQQQQAATQQIIEVSRKASQDLLISNQVAKGFEQLAGKETTMRLGGLYALEGVMNTSSAYHQPVLEALCAFVREGTIGMIVNETPAPDIQAALTVIGRRKEGAGRVDLSRAIIPRADLSLANLSGATLYGADLRAAILSYANLSRAYLGRANLIGADLIGADLSDANLIGADLIGASLSVANLSVANLSRANLSGAGLSLANLIVANLSLANLTRANLSGATLYGADLRAANLSRADLIGADLSGADLSLANLSLANLSLANLTLANLTLANLSLVNLTDANLSGAKDARPEQLARSCGQLKALPPDFPAGFRLADCPPDWEERRKVP